MIDINKFKQFGKKWSFAILDYNKPKEAFLVLESIKNRIKIPRDLYEVVYYSNGGNQEYVIDLYKQGLIDKLILSKENEGCNAGTIRLVNSIATEYFFFLEVDNEIGVELTQHDFDKIEQFLSNNYIINLSGLEDVSQRAFIIKTELYKSCEFFPMGGPGPYEVNNNGIGGDQWTEESLQKFVRKNNIPIVNLPIIKNNGKYTIRELPNGDGLFKIRCDTKQLWVLKRPKNKYNLFGLSDKEWDKIITGNWVDGDIPENNKKDSFNCFGE